MMRIVLILCGFLCLNSAFLNLNAQCTYTVTNTANTGIGSFRAAIINANSCPEASNIVFAIPAASTINLLSDLPALNNSGISINGNTAIGYSFPNAMVTLSWPGLDDCIDILSGDSITIKGLTFTNDFNGTGQGSIHAWAGDSLLVENCRAFNQNRKLLRVEGATNVRLKNSVAQNFSDEGAAMFCNIVSGSLIEVSGCEGDNLPRKIIEIVDCEPGTRLHVFNNVFSNIGHEDGIGCTKTSHAFSSDSSNVSWSFHDNVISNAKSKVFEMVNSGGTPVLRDSIFNNVFNNCTGLHTLYIESSESVYGHGIVIKNNEFNGDGGVCDVDQVIELGGYGNYMEDARIEGNTIRDYKGRAIMFRGTDNTYITGNKIYNISAFQAIEMNDDCDQVIIQGNFIGTDELGTAGLSLFTNNVVQLNDCDNCIIGGDRTIGEGNVIIAPSNGLNRKCIEAAGLCEGITIIRGNDLNVYGNGLTCMSTSGDAAIRINGSTAIIGGDKNLYMNRIAGGAAGRGIHLATPGNIVQGNVIGCTVFGDPVAGSAMNYGIFNNGDQTTIGDLNQPELYSNRIGYNIEAIRNSNKVNVLWTGNTYHGNTGAVVVNNEGVLANATILPPVIAGVTLPNLVNGTAVPDARVELYLWNSELSCQGYEYLGFTLADANGDWTFNSPVEFLNSVAASQIDGLNNSSEFRCFEIEILPCPGDFNFDGSINSGDLLLLLSEFGCSSDCNYEMVDDGISNVGDLIAFLLVFGLDCP